jgi:hypothetical protein
LLDIGFITYDIVQIAQEGWTPVNTGALALDIACAVLPIATGGGPALRGALAGGAAIAQASVRVPEVIRAGQALEKLVQFASNGETADTIRGREAHNNYPSALGDDYVYDKSLPSGQRPDAVDWENQIVRELKPDNPSAISRGWNQIRKYIGELSEITGKTWTGFVDTYAK